MTHHPLFFFAIFLFLFSGSHTRSAQVHHVSQGEEPQEEAREQGRGLFCLALDLIFHFLLFGLFGSLVWFSCLLLGPLPS